MIELPGNDIFGFDMNQNRFAVPVWDYAFSIHPPARVIELGSYNGGFSMALAFALQARGGWLHSFDRMQAPKQEWQEVARNLPLSFIRGDIWFLQEAIIGLMQNEGTCYLLCDGGDKPKEFNTFAQFLKPGDVIAAHDYQTPWWPWSEIKETDIVKSLPGLKRFLKEQMDLAGWIAYQKT